jgi:hypothetical protein
VHERHATSLGLDTAHTSRDAGFGLNSEQTDIPRLPTMRTTTEFFAERFDGHHPHLLAILIPKEGQRALGYRILNAHDLGGDSLILPHLVVHDRFNLIHIAGGQRSEVGKVEPQTIRPDE